MNMENNKVCFVMLWRKLEHTRQLLYMQHKRFCIWNIVKNWLGKRDDFVWQVCMLCEQEGYAEMLPPALYPRQHREFLRALVATTLHIGMRSIDLKALDSAYSEVFPGSTPINVSKKKR